MKKFLGSITTLALIFSLVFTSVPIDAFATINNNATGGSNGESATPEQTLTPEQTTTSKQATMSVSSTTQEPSIPEEQNTEPNQSTTPSNVVKTYSFATVKKSTTLYKSDKKTPVIELKPSTTTIFNV